jgi:gamma-glutamyl-gamma-aminobutyrate hydrolase PuuD
MSLPRIAISGVVRDWDGASRTGVNSAYVRSVVAAGGVPVILSPLMGAPVAGRALAGVDGLLLTGGEDLDPAWYGAEPSPLISPPSRERDVFELALFAMARQVELPILGICRGIQLVNVALGGSLYQDLPTERPGPTEHNRPVDRATRSHPVRLRPGSRAAEALGTTELTVNSFHHQGLRELAPGLVATGWSEDGLIEAAEGALDDAWLLAVQWHPEEMNADVAAPDRGLFKALIEQAGKQLVRAELP